MPEAALKPRLKLANWCYIILDADQGQIQVSVDGGEWVDHPSMGSIAGPGDAWAPVIVPLSEYAGLSVRVGFRLTTDGSNMASGIGWYIDDVSLETGPMNWSPLEDFEAGFGDWSVEGGCWAIGEPTFAEGPAPYSGTKVAGTALHSIYGASQDGRLVTPEFLVPSAAGNPRLTFASWYSIINDGDYGQVEVSVDGGPWQSFPNQGPLTATNSGWAPGNLLLSSYAGQYIRIGFRLVSNGTNPLSGAGWYIDDVELRTD